MNDNMAPLSKLDRAVIEATAHGLPLDVHPYRITAERIGAEEHQVISSIERMLQNRMIRRIGVVPNHYKLGLTANGMTVWDVADEAAEEYGRQIGALEFVSHCYLRPRKQPDWPYNLFAMVHCRSREEVQAKAQEISCILGSSLRSSDILFSTRILKKTGLRLATRGPQCSV